MKAFPIYYVYGFVLMNAYTKSDIKAIQSYAESFPTHEDVDYTRSQLEKDIDVVIDKFSNCSNEHQLRTILKKQPINIKFFIFERMQAAINSLTALDVEYIQVEDSVTTGQAFAQFLQKTWGSLVRNAEKKNDSVSELSLRILLDNY